jgi:hypothetical protein
MAGRTRRRMWLSLGAGVILLAAQAAMRVEAAAPLVSPSGAGTVSLGPQAMAGDLKIKPGDVLRAGFDFSMPGGHPATTAVFTSGYVALLVTCPNGSSPPLTIPLRDQTVVDPKSGAETNLADFGEGTPTTGTPTALDSASHTFYLIREAPDFSSQLFSLNIVTNALTAGPVLATPVLAITFDPSLGTLFAVTGCCPSPAQLVRLDPVSGVEAPVGTTDLGIVTSDMAINPASHTIYITQSMNSVDTRLLSIDDVTGSVVFGPALGGEVRSLVFEP